MILSHVQAVSIYFAMLSLKSVGARIKATFGDMDKQCINVFEDEEGFVKVVRIVKYSMRGNEFYENQAAFAAAYNLQQV